MQHIQILLLELPEIFFSPQYFQPKFGWIHRCGPVDTEGQVYLFLVPQQIFQSDIILAHYKSNLYTISISISIKWE